MAPAIIKKQPKITANTGDAPVIDRLQAIADASRLRMLTALSNGRELCVCDLMAMVELSQPLTSHHLRVLREAGLVEYRRQGTWLYYRQNTQAVAELTAQLSTMLNGPARAVQTAARPVRPRECPPVKPS